MNAVQKAFYNGEDYGNCYLFSPSISRRKNVGRQTYYVRRYFRGGNDFEKTMKTLAVQRTTTNMRNIIYLGHMPQLMSSSVSYKNHKRYKKDKSEWVIVYNTHEPIISQELWDRVEARRSSLAQGRKRLKTGFTHPLSGFLICADCGCKM